MTISTRALDDAIKHWYNLVRVEHPLFEMPVEKSPAKGKANHRGNNLWSFATNKRRIMAYLHQPEKIDEAFEKVVAGLYARAYAPAPSATSPGTTAETSSGTSPGDAGDIVNGGKAVNAGNADNAGSAGATNEPRKEFQRTITYHNKFSLLVHELFHNLFCPDSREDRRQINKALAAGIREAEPAIKAADLVAKVRNVQNLAWDFCIDTFQYDFLARNAGPAGTLRRELCKSGYTLNGQPAEQFPEGVLPIFDVVSCSLENKLPRGVYAIGRITYSLLFCGEPETREGLLQYFDGKIARGVAEQNKTRKAQEANGAAQEAHEAALASLEALVKEIPPEKLLAKGFDAVGYKARIGQLRGVLQNNQPYDNAAIVRMAASLLMDKSTRYDALKGYIQPLAKFIDVAQFQPRCGHDGMGGEGDGDSSGEEDEPEDGGAGDALDDILDALLQDMSPQEQQQFLQQLAAGAGDKNNPYLQKLALAGLDEYYKKHAPKIVIETPGSGAVTVSIGTRKEWVRTKTLKVLPTELHRHQRWIDFGLQHGLPVLAEVVPGKAYHVTYFRREEKAVETYEFKSEEIDVARNWILLNDSSGTMGGGIPGSGTRWDGLLHMDYGLLKALYDASRMTGKEVDLWVVNFSSATQVAGPLPLQKFYDSKTTDDKRILLAPQNGGTELDTSKLRRIERQLKPGRTVWSFTTDGDIHNSSEVEKYIRSLSARPEQGVLFFEIFHRSGLGTNLQNMKKPNVQYVPVTSMDSILKASLKVLVQYEK